MAYVRKLNITMKEHALQLRDKTRRQADEEAQTKAELAAAEHVRAEREAAMKAREAAAAAATRALSEEIRKYNECGAPSLYRSCQGTFFMAAIRLVNPLHPLSKEPAADAIQAYHEPAAALDPCVMWCMCLCREKIEADKRRTLEERDADAAWMRGVLAREAEQIAEEDALRERQKLELQRWLHALQTASRAEALVMFSGSEAKQCPHMQCPHMLAFIRSLNKLKRTNTTSYTGN